MKFMDILCLYVVFFYGNILCCFFFVVNLVGHLLIELFNGFRREALVVVMGLEATLVEGPNVLNSDAAMAAIVVCMGIVGQKVGLF